VRLPVDWDSVDPIPPALAAILAAPGPVDVPLDDVVPGDPNEAVVVAGAAETVVAAEAAETVAH
jgi:hypothetical protein